MITIETIFLGAIIHGIALFLLLTFNSYQNRRANMLLAGMVLLLTIGIWNMFAYSSEQNYARLIIDVYLWVTPLLWGPFLYLYTGQLTRLRPVTARLLILHSLPAIVVALLQIPLHLIYTAEPDSMITNSSYKFADLSYKFIVLFFYPQLAGYFYLCVRDLKLYRETAKQRLSSIEKIKLTWLSKLIALFTVILACDMALTIPMTFFEVYYPKLYNAIFLAEAVTVFAIGYLSLRQPEILAGQSFEQNIDAEKNSGKYMGSPVDEKLGAELAEKLDTLMEDRQLFLENDLTLSDLAREAGLMSHHLSQVINQHKHRSFYEYVNGYRARFAADHLRRHGKTNLTQLAFDSGFNNRASFFRSFKKYTGQTPTSFAKSADKHETV